MRRRILTLLSIFLVGGGIWWFWKSGEKKPIREELAFDIEDTARIFRISLLDRAGQKILLERKSGGWMLNDDIPARKHAVDNLLKTIHDQRVSALIPVAAKDNVVKDLSSRSIRVSLRDRKNQVLLTFYVGGVTPDERGTFMIREGSEWPVIVGVPGFEGALRSRYVMPELDWISRKLLPDISGFTDISIDYPGQQEHSMQISASGTKWQVIPLHRPDITATEVNRYVCEAYGDILNDLQAEAVLDPERIPDFHTAIPFCQIRLVGPGGSEHELLFYPTEWIDAGAGERLPSAVERYYVIYNGSRLFLTQHPLMQKAFVGYEHFVQTNRELTKQSE